MTREDILRMARDAGIRIASPMDTLDPRNVYAHELERFAALVAAAEREACAKVCEVEAAFCGDNGKQDAVGSLCAAAIRARGQE